MTNKRSESTALFGATALYGVIGNPIAHSRSPQIHLAFGAQTNRALSYERILAIPDDFDSVVRQFAADGGQGLNVTVPFKERAVALADQVSDRARIAGAANTLSFSVAGITADNTDGIGLVHDIGERCSIPLSGATVVLIGAGGAARGVLQPMLAAGVQSLFVINRTLSRAAHLIELAKDLPVARNRRLQALSFEQSGDVLPIVESSDAPLLIINATAASLSGQQLPLPDPLLAAAVLSYDMVYSDQATSFMTQASDAGCTRVVDGLGMLIQQAAESFGIWHGVRPETESVYRLLRPAN